MDINLEGAIVVKKDVIGQKELGADLVLPNLEVMKLLQSFASRGYVEETFNWRYYYYSLTDAGIKYLREYLGLPEDIVPATLKKTNVSVRPSFRPPSDDKRKSVSGSGNPDFRRGAGRDSYRRKEA